MLVCTKCGHVADNDADEWVVHKYFNPVDERGGFTEVEYYCPICGGDEVVEAKKCDHCGEYFDPDTLVLATVEYPPDDEYPDGSEDILEVCPECYEDYYFKEDEI